MDQLRPLEAAPTLDRLIAILASYKPTIQALGKYVNLKHREHNINRIISEKRCDLSWPVAHRIPA